MEWTTRENSIIKVNDFVKDTFTNKICKLLSFRNHGKGNEVALLDLKSNKITVVAEGRVVKVERDCKEEWLKNASSQKVIEILISIIHEAFTVAADKLHQFGYMEEKERIKLSNIIGDTLDFFKNRVNNELADVAKKVVDDDKISQIAKGK